MLIVTWLLYSVFESSEKVASINLLLTIFIFLHMVIRRKGIITRLGKVGTYLANVKRKTSITFNDRKNY